jgi:hypothetical protein
MTMPQNFKESAKLILTSEEYNPLVRPIAQRSMGFYCEGLSLPHPNIKDPSSQVHGLLKRVLVKTPTPNRFTKRRLRRFVKQWCHKNMTPLDPEIDMSFETWINERPYEAWRKDELKQVYYSIIDDRAMEHFLVNGFIKDETYPDFKQPRGINARCDAAKVLTGPIFHQIELELFKLPHFIKKIPKHKRADYIYDYLYDPNSVYYASDYKSFESHFTKEILHTIEFEFYLYMCKDLVCLPFFKWFLYNIVAGWNDIKFSFFRIIIEATRMTGEMNTSLGNGFANLMLTLYCAWVSGYDPNIFRVLIEGDDGLSRLDPTRLLNVDVFKDCGFTIEAEVHLDLCTAGFCGNVFDPEDRIIITDVREAMVAIGWTTNRYAKSKRSKIKGLLRAKAMSLLYEYPGCPVLQSLASYLIRVTEGYRANPGVMNMYQKEQAILMYEYMQQFGLPTRPVPSNTRYLVERLYNIPVDVQLQWEAYFDNCTELKPFDSSLLRDVCPVSWSTYFSIYSSELDLNFVDFGLDTHRSLNQEYIDQLIA